MKKSFYVFLCGLLGMLLFILLQRSLFLLAFLAGVDVLSFDFQRLDYFTFVLATFSGLWYGIWLGLHWYFVVYEEMSVSGVLSGLFRSFGRRKVAFNESRGNNWNLDDLVNMKSEELVDSRNSSPRIQIFESDTVAIGTESPVHADDLHTATELAPKKRPTVRRTSKRPIRKV